MTQTYPSYSRPDPSNLHSEVDIRPRTLAPLYEPLFHLPHPPLPSPIRNPSFTPSYTLTTHLYPSAYPRAPSSPLTRSEYADIPGETKSERVERQKALIHRLARRNRLVHEGSATGGESATLWNVMNRYVRKNSGQVGGGVTLFLAHANGFPKEIWEPSLLEIFSRAESANVVIDEVWSFEAVQHGDSALVNETVAGDVFDWADNARDILNFLLYYLPSAASPASLSTHLQRLPEDVAAKRRELGYENRTVVGIGHSLGGCSTARVALAHPSLFSSLVLVDPVIIATWLYPGSWNTPSDLALLAIRRRCNWSSREEAVAGFRKSPFFSAWHPATLEKYIQYGLGPDPDAKSKDAVRLKMSGAQEAVVFIDKRLAYETWQLLPQLDERIELRFIVSGKDIKTLGGELAARELVWRRPQNASNVLVAAGHLIPQEVPVEFAILVVEFLERKYGKKQVRKALL